MSIVKVNDTQYGLRDNQFRMLIAVGTRQEMIELWTAINQSY